MHKAVLKIFLAITIGIIAVPYLQGQNISSQNIQNVNVDELSDAQIRKYVDQAQSSGYSIEQLEVMARARGMSDLQISKLKQRINSLSSGLASSGTSSSGRERISPNGLSDPFVYLGSASESQQKGLTIFGMDFFQNSNLTFQPSLNIATPKDYQIGPGDEIIIDIWGASEQTYRVAVSPEGSILIPSLGPIYLNGLSIDRAESRIKYKLKAIYSTLGDNTFAQVSLGQIRTISVNIIGEAAAPGTYQLSSFGTILNALYMAGGPNKNGSLRDIQIFRNGAKVADFDAYSFLVFGKGENVKLQDQDVILIKPYLNRVSIEGEVKRPALYEMKDDETLADLLSICGGFNPTAYQQTVSFQRNLNNKKTVITVSKDEFSSVNLKSGDKISVSEIQDLFENRVTIKGAVNHPGEFALEEEMKLSDLILLADGFSPDVFLNRALIIRQKPDFTLNTLSFSPKEVLDGTYDISLHSEDLIIVHSLFEMREEWKVTIQGEVQEPGEYDYKDNLTVEDLIFQAKGFKESAARSFVEVARRPENINSEQIQTAELFSFPISDDLHISDDASSFVLKPFDVVVIRESPFFHEQEVVQVKGEVLYPGKYVLNSKTEKISDVIKRAGGFTPDAYPVGASLIRQSEYFDNEDLSRVKKQKLDDLAQMDSTALKGTFRARKQEGVAVDIAAIDKNPSGSDNLIMKDGDIITIPRKFQTVRVRGEVYFPNKIVYKSGSNFRKYISQSGGFSQKAKKSKSYVLYANGSAKRTRNFVIIKDYPKVEPGSEIIVPRKPDRDKMTPQGLVALTSGFATLTWLVLNIVNSISGQ